MWGDNNFPERLKSLQLPELIHEGFFFFFSSAWSCIFCVLINVSKPWKDTHSKSKTNPSLVKHFFLIGKGQKVLQRLVIKVIILRCQ